MLTETLVKFGLSDKEAKVYLALLELEVAGANEIAKKAEINRSSTYVVLEALQKRGLVSVSAGKSLKKYIVAPPEKIAQLAERAAKRELEVSQEVSSIIPDLKSLYKGTKSKPRIRVYEGRESIISCMEETLKNREKVLRVCSSAEKLEVCLQGYLSLYVKKRRHLGIRMYGIHPDDIFSKHLRKLKSSVDTSIFIPPDKFKFKSNLIVYDNFVSYISDDGTHAFLIESEEIAETMKSTFDLAFEGAKRLAGAKKRATLQ